MERLRRTVALWPYAPGNVDKTVAWYSRMHVSFKRANGLRPLASSEVCTHCVCVHRPLPPLAPYQPVPPATRTQTTESTACSMRISTCRCGGCIHNTHTPHTRPHHAQLAWLRHGRLPWSRLVQPAADIARHGFAAHPAYVDVVSGPNVLHRLKVRRCRCRTGAAHVSVPLVNSGRAHRGHRLEVLCQETPAPGSQLPDYVDGLGKE